MTLFDLEPFSSDPLPKPPRPEAPTPPAPQTMQVNGHHLTLEDGKYSCSICGRSWKKSPVQECPGVKIYKWGCWPANLRTKTQLEREGYQTGKALPNPCGIVYWDKLPNGVMWLYDIEQATKRKILSPEEKAARKAKTQQTQLCPRCGVRSRVWTKYTPRYRRGRQQGYYSEYGRWDYCQVCEAQINDEVRRQEVAEQFERWLGRRDCLILDTETTALYGEIIEIAVIDSTGNVLLNQRLNPKSPGLILESGAYGIHGIHPHDLGLCPRFPEIYPHLVSLLEGRNVVIFNSEYDIACLNGETGGWGLPHIQFGKIYCAMLAYSRYVGDFLDYRNDYRYQRLPSGDHSALGDCRATLKLMRDIIEQEKQA